VRDEIETFTSHDIRPFGVNPASVESHSNYAAKLGLPGHPMAATLAQLEPRAAPVCYSAVASECHGMTSRSISETTA